MKSIIQEANLPTKFIVKILLSALLLVVTSCNQKAHNDNQKTNKVDTNKKLIISVGGLPNWDVFERKSVVAKRWGIEYDFLGCSGSYQAEINNKPVGIILEKRHGKFWKEIFNQEVIEEELNWILVYDLLKKDKHMLDKRKELGKEAEYLHPRISSLNKNEYKISVTHMANVKGGFEYVSYFRFLVNVNTKKVTLISDKLIKVSKGGYN